MDRRAFMAMLGVGVDSLDPSRHRAKKTDRKRRVGALVLDVDHAPARSLVTAFRQRLEQLGWVVGTATNDQRKVLT